MTVHRLDHLFKANGLFQPCFRQLQLAVRSVLHPPSNRQPHFIVLQALPLTSGASDCEAIPLFTSPRVPSPTIHASFPRMCPCDHDCPDLLVIPRSTEATYWLEDLERPEHKTGKLLSCNVEGCDKAGAEGFRTAVCSRCRRVQ